MSHARARRLVVACLTALVGAVVAVPVAPAAPVPGPAGDAFYTPPSPLPPGQHGDLIWYRPVTTSLPGAPAHKAWQVLYRTQTARGADTVATGTVFVPTQPYVGTRPVVSYAVGTQGLGTQCRASAAYVAGTEYDAGGVVEALKKNLAVVSTDYQGYTNGGGPPPYIAGKGEGHDVLDIVRAASQIPGAGVSAAAKTAIWGYSQGGQAAAWAGELQPSYAPGLNLIGVAAGGVPGDLRPVALSLNGNIGAAFLGYAVIGLDRAYPDLIALDQRMNDKGRRFRDEIVKQCTFDSLPRYVFQRIEQYETAGTPLAQLLDEPGPAAALADAKLGTRPIKAPVLQYHAVFDEIIPFAQADALRRQYCAQGVKVQWSTYLLAEHLLGDFQATGDVARWIADRVAGKAPPNTCPAA